jgi:Glycosyltransferase WbsX
MKRRSFLTSAIGATIAAGTTRAVEAQTLSSTHIAKPVFADLPNALVGEAAVDGYFTDQKLHEALGTSTLAKPKDVQVVVYNFPSWHPSPFMEARFGKGWTEFDALRNARPLFPGHTMPHYPLWGYYDESDPIWAAKEVDLAADHGVDAWLIDWYWHEGTQFYQEQIEQGLLKAPNRDRIKFAVMWANHDWKNVYPARSPDLAAPLLPQVHTLADFERVANYCAEHYFSQSNYLHIDGAPLFAIFDAGKVIEQLGKDGLKRALETMRQRGATLGFPKLHLQLCSGYDSIAGDLAAFGVDSVTQYGTFGWTYGSKPPGSRIPYGVGASEGIASWKSMREKVRVPFYPCCQVGWDDSPRFEEFASIAINRSPDQFERVVRAARHIVASDKHSKFIYVAAWNEWTEDHVLLPDTTLGYSYLEALKRAIKD